VIKLQAIQISKRDCNSKTFSLNMQFICSVKYWLQTNSKRLFRGQQYMIGCTSHITCWLMLIQRPAKYFGCWPLGKITDFSSRPERVELLRSQYLANTGNLPNTSYWH